MDSFSWSLVARLAESSPEILLVMTSRDLDGTAPAEALARLERAGLTRVPLQPLALEERVILAGRTIGASALPPAIATWIAQRSGGNPLFCRELALAALENETVRIVDGQAELLADPGGGAGADLPRTLHGVITSRVDRLETREQITLRVASILGVKFSEEAMLAVHDAEPEATRADLGRLVERGFLDADSDPAAGRFSFHHVLLREAVYDSLPYRRRRELHSALARWMETRFADDLPAHAAALADHWERAEEWQLAFAALVRAGEAALRSYANREAVRHFAAAAAIRVRLPELRLHAAAWSPELGLARAHHRMGDERTSRRAIEDALRAAGEVLPRHALARMTAIARETAHRMLPAAIRTRPPRGPLRSPARLRDAVRAYDPLPEILYYENDPLAMTIAILRFARLAEAESQPSAERARAFGWLAILHSILGRRRALERTFDRALAVAADSGDAAVDAWLRLARGSALAQFGAWPEAERWLRESLERCAAMGDRTRWWNVMSALGHVLSYRGDLSAGAEIFAEALAANRDTDKPLFLCWGLAGRAEILHRLGRPRDGGETIRLLRAARSAHEQRPDRAADLFSRGLLAAALWRNAQTGEAYDLARDTIEHALEGVPVVWIQVGSFLGLTEVLGEAARDPALRDEAIRLLARLERGLRGFARLIPVGVPAQRLVRGTLEIARGRPRRARRVLAAGVEAAQRLAMPTELGRLHLGLAESLSDEAARAELERAIAVFSRIDARFGLRVARERLERRASS
jgi:tetratricopeptide (TPR) repeat protein